MKLFCFFLILLILPVLASGQSKADSLRTELSKHPSDTTRVRLLHSLAFQIYNTNTEEAMKLSEEALLLSKQLKYDRELNKIWNVIGICHYFNSDYNKSLESFQKALSYAEKHGKRTSALLNNVGLIYWAMKNTELALDYYLKALESSRKENDTKEIALTWANIANIYMANRIYDTAMFYTDSAVTFFQKQNNRSSLGNAYNNKANIFIETGDTLNAIFYYEKSIEEKKSAGSSIGYANSAYNLGNLYIKLKKYNKAEYYTNIAYDEAKKNNYRDMMARCLNNYAFIEKGKGNYKSAFEYYIRFFHLHDSIFNEGLNREIAEMKTAYETEKKEQIILRQTAELDKEKAENEARKLQQKQERYFLAGAGIVILLMGFLVFFIFRSYRQKKKANIVLQQQKEEIVQQKEEITSQRDEIESQRDEIISQRDQISHINKEITSSIQYAKRIQNAMLQTETILKPYNGNYFIIFKPRDIVSGDFYWCARVEDQLVIAVADCTGHGVPGAFMSMLGMSLLKEVVVKEYITRPDIVLKRIRKELISILGQKNVADRSNPSENITSGELSAVKDTPSDELSAVKDTPSDELSAVKDTPSAMLSAVKDTPSAMLSAVKDTPSAMLSAVKDTPSAMLSAVKDTPSAMLSAVKDGMDIALCSININTHELQFAGANNSLYIIKPAISHSPLAVGQGTPEANSQQLIELKGDKMPIGIHERMDNFTLQTIQLVNGDRLYMMSDGMSDQFGGPSGKKFLSRNIKNILTKTADYTIDNQRIYIENEINNWIGNPSGHYEQIDDITIFGIHF